MCRVSFCEDAFFVFSWLSSFTYCEHVHNKFSVIHRDKSGIASLFPSSNMADQIRSDQLWALILTLCVLVAANEVGAN